MEEIIQSMNTCKFCGHIGEDVHLHVVCDKEWIGCDDGDTCNERMRSPKKKTKERRCVICDAVLTWKPHWTPWCGEQCKQKYITRQKERDGGLNPPVGVYQPATLGAIKEYEVVIDLLKKGYDVYRACSPNSVCDLVTIKDGKVIRIEVTTGRYTPKEGRYHFDNHQAASDGFDIIAVVLHDKIIYLAKSETAFAETQL